MKIKQYYSWMVAAAMAVATPFLAACSSEENLAPSRGVAITDAHIVINVEPYGATPSAARSRAAEAPAVTKPDTVLLANGMRAVVSMEEDAPETQAATRATMDDGHYTIFALDPTTGDRITGTKKQLTGTVTGGVFQSDAGSEMILDPGTYKFVCINDAVTDHGTWLEVSTGVSNNPYGPAAGTIPTASDAQIGTSTETINGDDWQVTFLMKHQNARIRLRLVAYTNQLENAVGALTGSLTEYPVTLKYALDGSTPVVTEKTYPYNYAIAKLTLPNAPTESNATYVRANNFYSNYMYVMPGSDGISLYLGEGKAYGKSFNLASPTQLASQFPPTTFQRSHSYTITYRILPNALYLFEDGSCGALAEKGSRTPIGVVTKEKTNSEEGTAMALKDADGGTTIGYGQWGSRMFVYNNTKQYEEDFSDAADDMDGYKWTYDPAGSADGTVKANNNSDYTIFSSAASYNPGISPVAPTIGKWYLPAMGEWMQAFTSLTGKTFQQGTAYGSHILYIDDVDPAKLNKCFEDAGGMGLVRQIGGGYTNRAYWTSSEIKPFYLNHPVARFDFSGGQYKICIAIGSKHNGTNLVRPFVHF